MVEELIKQLPEEAQSYYKAVEAKAVSIGSANPSRVALKAVRDKLIMSGNTFVARSKDFELFTTVHYSFAPEETTITRSNDGFVYVKQPLASTKSINGISFSRVALQRGMEQINIEGVKGRIDAKHKLMESLHKQGLSPAEIEEEIQKFDGGIEATSAVIDGDKLIANLKIRNDVFESASSFKAASIEARYPDESLRAGVTDQMRITGFVLTDDPADTGMVRV